MLFKISLISLDGPPPKIKTFKRQDVDRIYSEYLKTTLKAAADGGSKHQLLPKPLKEGDFGGEGGQLKTGTVKEKTSESKRKYRKRLKEQQTSGLSLLKPLNQHQQGKLICLANFREW